jgi:hypothetical protein
VVDSVGEGSKRNARGGRVTRNVGHFFNLDMEFCADSDFVSGYHFVWEL